MFDVGFSEMLVIGIVALVVIGPERLPKVARTIGHLVGRAQRYVNDVKRDIDREVQIDELRKLQAQMQDAARNIETSVSTTMADVKTDVDQAQKTIEEAVDGNSATGSPTPAGPAAAPPAGPAADPAPVVAMAPLSQPDLPSRP